MTPSPLLEKYAAIIQEEVNVKEITAIAEELDVTPKYVPLGSALSALFGKDTGQIIAAAKEGNAALTAEQSLRVWKGAQERVLPAGSFEIRYEHIDLETYWIGEGVVVSLDTTLTPELKREGLARELSRACNQLRKEADYRIDEHVYAWIQTDDAALAAARDAFTTFLCQEALLVAIDTGMHSGDITQTLSIEGASVTITLARTA